MKLKKRLPWWLRIAAKIVLARLPISHSFWKRIRLFELGEMNLPEHAFQIYLTHAQIAGMALPHQNASTQGFTVLEIGPGDSLFTAIIAKTFGASRTWLVDCGDFAIKDPKAYMGMAEYLRSKKYKLQFDTTFDDTIDVLKKCNATYLTDGVQSLSTIPSDHVDFCFSNAVLEHIPKEKFTQLLFELKRILKKDGICSHRVDLKDHLGGGLNNLRFSSSVWEGSLFRRSGFYTNRIRYGQMLLMFDQAGFSWKVTRKDTWEKLPIVRSSLNVEFQSIPDDDLLISGFDVVLRHKVNE